MFSTSMNPLRRRQRRLRYALDRAAALHIDEGYPRWGYETLDAERERLAAFVGCTKDELAIVHNATEAMSIIAGGMPLKAGDEVLLTDQGQAAADFTIITDAPVADSRNSRDWPARS